MEDNTPAGVALANIGRHNNLKASYDILGSDGDPGAPVENLIDQYMKDSYLVFRALCKLSMKPLPTPDK
jgi:hypothetical protein